MFTLISRSNEVMDSIDLHGLTVEVALIVVRNILEQSALKDRKRGDKVHFFIYFLSSPISHQYSVYHGKREPLPPRQSQNQTCSDRLSS